MPRKVPEGSPELSESWISSWLERQQMGQDCLKPPEPVRSLLLHLLVLSSLSRLWEWWTGFYESDQLKKNPVDFHRYSVSFPSCIYVSTEVIGSSRSEPIHLPGVHSPSFLSCGGLWFVTHFLQISPHCCFSSVSRLPSTTKPWRQSCQTLTGTMPELEADVRSPEFIHRDRKFQQLRPPGTVVMIKHKGVVLASWWLSRAKGDKILIKEICRLKTASFQDDVGRSRAIALLYLPAPQIAFQVKLSPQFFTGLFLHLLLLTGCVCFILRLVSQGLLR